MDRRRLWSNGRVAHSSLKGQVEAKQFVEGDWAQVAEGKVPLLDAPEGKRERELLYGEPFCVLEWGADHIFGFALRDEYTGYIARDCLFDAYRQPTHFVDAPRTYMKGTPDFKTYEPVFDLSFGSLVEVLEEQGRWSGIAVRFNDEPGKLWTNWMPSAHLRPIQPFLSDPVEVAGRFVGTPYLWAGNSAFGIECSGLVQTACLACGITCPGDSDMQEAELGEPLTEGEPLKRGDLLFWKGHVAWVVDPETILHANAHHMAVAYEGLEAAIARIEAQGDGPVTARKRLKELSHE